jgi:hypothetical protein
MLKLFLNVCMFLLGVAAIYASILLAWAFLQ